MQVHLSTELEVREQTMQIPEGRTECRESIKAMRQLMPSTFKEQQEARVAEAE